VTIKEESGRIVISEWNFSMVKNWAKADDTSMPWIARTTTVFKSVFMKCLSFMEN
jgi:hypothetical protein